MVNIVTPVKVNHGWLTTTTDTRNYGSVTSLFSGDWLLGNDVQNGIENRNWREQVAKGINATTPYTRVVWSGLPIHLFGRMSVTHKLPGQNPYTISSNGFHRIIFGETQINSGDDTALRDRALASLKRKLSSSIGNKDLIVPIVELKDLRGLIRNSAGLATTLLKTLVDIKKTRGRSAARWASKAWLNYSFGVKPLISETNAAINSVGDFLTRQDFTTRLTAISSKTWKSSTVRTGTGLHTAGYRVFGDFEHTLSYKYTASASLNLKSGNNYDAIDHFGLDISSLPSLGWELLPYSWVVDYFTNVGDFLSDTFVLPPGSLRYLVLNKRYEMNGRFIGGYVPTEGWLSQGQYPGFLKYYRLERSSLSSLPHIGLRFKSQDEIGFSAVNKLLNLASILIK